MEKCWGLCGAAFLSDLGILATRVGEDIGLITHFLVPILSTFDSTALEFLLNVINRTVLHVRLILVDSLSQSINGNILDVSSESND